MKKSHKRSIVPLQKFEITTQSSRPVDVEDIKKAILKNNRIIIKSNITDVQVKEDVVQYCYLCNTSLDKDTMQYCRRCYFNICPTCFVPLKQVCRKCEGELE